VPLEHAVLDETPTNHDREANPMTLDRPDVGALRALRVHQEVADALYRFAAGQDLKDPDLFLSAFAPDATLDFTHPARRFGADIPVMRGRDTIATILDTLEPLVTSHTVTNPRVADLGDGRAGLSALVEAQHVSRSDPQRHLLLKNVYDVTLVAAGDRYLVESMTIRTLWHDGDPSVLFGPASPGAELVRGADASWIDQGSGVELAPLRVVGAAAGTALLRFAAGGRSPAHRHPGGEELYVLSGRLRVGERWLEAGDFLHTPPGEVHDAEADVPTVAIVSVPEPVEFLESA
jgi:quercetin dioxygenase-like cupin family protein